MPGALSQQMPVNSTPPAYSLPNSIDAMNAIITPPVRRDAGGSVPSAFSGMQADQDTMRESEMRAAAHLIGSLKTAQTLMSIPDPTLVAMGAHWMSHATDMLNRGLMVDPQTAMQFPTPNNLQALADKHYADLGIPKVNGKYTTDPSALASVAAQVHASQGENTEIDDNGKLSVSNPQGFTDVLGQRAQANAGKQVINGPQGIVVHNFAGAPAAAGEVAFSTSQGQSQGALDADLQKLVKQGQISLSNATSLQNQRHGQILGEQLNEQQRIAQRENDNRIANAIFEIAKLPGSGQDVTKGQYVAGLVASISDPGLKKYFQDRLNVGLPSMSGSLKGTGASAGKRSGGLLHREDGGDIPDQPEMQLAGGFGDVIGNMSQPQMPTGRLYGQGPSPGEMSILKRNEEDYDGYRKEAQALNDRKIAVNFIENAAKGLSTGPLAPAVAMQLNPLLQQLGLSQVVPDNMNTNRMQILSKEINELAAKNMQSMVQGLSRGNMFVERIWNGATPQIATSPGALQGVLQHQRDLIDRRQEMVGNAVNQLGQAVLNQKPVLLDDNALQAQFDEKHPDWEVQSALKSWRKGAKGQPIPVDNVDPNDPILRNLNPGESAAYKDADGILHIFKKSGK